MRFLVTGGAGFIGSHIAERLLKEKYFVRVLDNFSSGKKENLYFLSGAKFKPRFELLRGDIREKNICLKACKGIDSVLHQAALRSVPKSLLNPAAYNEVNINGTLNMLEAARENKVKSFVFASSSSIYGEATDFPEKEDFPPAPVSPYALSKLTGEHYCKIFSLAHGLPTVSLRYFNVFGPRQSLDDEYAVVIPKFINCLLHGRPFPIYGSGEQSRDFTYVDNVVEANILAAVKTGFSGEVFNAASGRDCSVLELARILNNLARKDPGIKFLPPRPGDVFRTLGDLSKSKKMLGYQAKTGFIDGLKLTLEYFETNA
ncbi:MAG: hypothetical protein A3G38_02205 [Omnitrophica WOR_2 bacterium RIFCSPLOWO2_12_FULL_51_8]|nr:MAG: hypothetical protein A3G38_02205 [Omnitrophica WOR_2 bacterium RIFCSPLOWO2_12_FULL_51_8]